MADHPEDTAIIAERDAARAQAANAEREAGAAEAAGDRPRAIQLYHQARDLTRTAEQADRQLRFSLRPRSAVGDRQARSSQGRFWGLVVLSDHRREPLCL